MLATFLEARYQAPLAVEAYSPSILAAVALVVALAPWLLRQPHPSLALGTWPACLPIVSLPLTFVMVGAFTGRAEDFPAPLAVPAQAYFAQREADVYIGPRDAVRYAGAIRPRFEKVILIVDESVRGDYVGFNEPRLDNTPFLVSQLPIPGELRGCFVVLQLLDDGPRGPALRGARGGLAGSASRPPFTGPRCLAIREGRGVPDQLFRHLALGPADVEHADLRRAALCG